MLVVVAVRKQLKGDEQAFSVQPVVLSPIDFGVRNSALNFFLYTNIFVSIDFVLSSKILTQFPRIYVSIQLLFCKVLLFFNPNTSANVSTSTFVFSKTKYHHYH